MGETKYIKPDKKIITKLLDFLYHNVVAEGGDGDVLWYSRYFKITDILIIIQEYDDALSIDWTVKINEHGILQWGQGEEWISITNKKEVYDADPEWQTVKLKF